MCGKPITPLRRMLEDMALRKFGEKTQADYIRHAEPFAVPQPLAGYGTANDLRRFQVHLSETGCLGRASPAAAAARRVRVAGAWARAEMLAVCVAFPAPAAERSEIER
jgi:integrase/recombinase XerD